MAGDFGIVDLSVKRGIHNFPAPIDLENNGHTVDAVGDAE
jgi:hypothetical protein